MLPVQLPKIDKLSSVGNPLDKMKEWKKITIEGKKCIRETDTLRYFCRLFMVFLRFCSPNNKEYGFDIDEV
jgi:leucyl-tRNA synthetase